MRAEELNELAHFLAYRSPEPSPRQFEPFYGEILDLVRLLMIPAGWLPNPPVFKDPGRARRYGKRAFHDL